MDKKIGIITALLGALAVGMGAFGAHGLEPLLEKNGRLDTFQTAVDYHMFHTVLLLFLTVSKVHKRRLIAGLTLAGIVIFSGSLYVLSITNLNVLGAVTPIGGVLFIISWMLLGWFIYKKP